MYATGHYGAALLAYAPVGYLLVGVDPVLAVLGGIGVLSLATLPDVDLRLPLVPHRGPTHSLLFLAVVASALGGAGWVLGGAAPGVDRTGVALFGAGVAAVGVGSHLLADMLTPAGVNVLWPLPGPAVSFRVARADNTLANWGLLGLGAFATALVFLLVEPGF